MSKKNQDQNKNSSLDNQDKLTKDDTTKNDNQDKLAKDNTTKKDDQDKLTKDDTTKKDNQDKLTKNDNQESLKDKIKDEKELAKKIEKNVENAQNEVTKDTHQFKKDEKHINRDNKKYDSDVIKNDQTHNNQNVDHDNDKLNKDEYKLGEDEEKVTESQEDLDHEKEQMNAAEKALVNDVNKLDKEREEKLKADVHNPKYNWIKYTAVGILGLLIGIGGTYGVLHTHDNSTTIATIGENHTKLTQKDLNDVLANNSTVKAVASHQLTLKVLASLYPEQYKDYQKDVNKYIDTQAKNYGGKSEYEAALAITGNSLQNVKDSYLLTNMISYSVMKNYPPSKHDLQDIYNHTDHDVYKLSGVLVRNKDQANKAQDMIHQGKSYKEVKKSINSNDVAYLGGHDANINKNKGETLRQLRQQNASLADGVSKMSVGDTSVIHSKNLDCYFVVTLNAKKAQTYKEALPMLKSIYQEQLLLNQDHNYIAKSIIKDYKKAHVKIKDKDYNYLNNLQQFYLSNLNQNQF